MIPNTLSEWIYGPMEEPCPSSLHSPLLTWPQNLVWLPPKVISSSAEISLSFPCMKCVLWILNHIFELTCSVIPLWLWSYLQCVSGRHNRAKKGAGFQMVARSRGPWFACPWDKHRVPPYSREFQYFRSPNIENKNRVKQNKTIFDY